MGNGNLTDAVRRTIRRMMEPVPPMDYRGVLPPLLYRDEVERVGADEAAKYFIEAQPMPPSERRPVYVRR